MMHVEPSVFFIDKRSKVPPYDQLLDDIIRSIINQTVLKGDFLPSVEDLAAYFQMSQNEVEAVYKTLAERHYLSFEAPHEILYEPTPNYLFLSRNTIAASLGKKPEDVAFITLKKEIYQLKPEQALAKRFKPNETVLSIERVYLSDDQPRFYARIEIPLSLFPDFLDHYNDTVNTWDVFKTHYQLTLDNHHSQLRVVALPKDIAKALNLPIEAPSYQLLANVYDDDDRSIEYYEIYTPSSYYFQLKSPRTLLRQQFQRGCKELRS